MNSDAVIGGIVGAAAASLLALGGWVWSARREVRLNDLRVTLRDEDIREWAVGRRRRLARRLQEFNDKFNAAHKGADSGARRTALIVLKVVAGDEMRERLRQARAARREIIAGEDWRHRMWRRGRALPEVRATDDRRVAELAGLDFATLHPSGDLPEPPLIT